MVRPPGGAEYFRKVPPPPDDREGDRIRNANRIRLQVAELREKAATYKTNAANYEKSAFEMEERLMNSRNPSTPFTSKDAEWMEKRTTSNVGGYRGPFYDNAPQYMKDEFDFFESYFNSQNYKGGAALLLMDSWAIIKKFGGDSKHEMVQEHYRAVWLIEIQRADFIALDFRKKAQQLENEAARLEQKYPPVPHPLPRPY